jgi:fructose-1-phosphate kinase PfkB-like protein
MSKVITVTLNPSLDRTIVATTLNLGYSNRLTEPARFDPAGRGVNIARALHRLGCETNAVLLMGDDAVSLSYRALIEAERLPFTPIVRQGRTRSNVIIVETVSKSETQLIEESTVGTEDDISALLDALKGLTRQGDHVVLAGDLTVDGPRDTYARLIEQVRAMGAQVTLSTNGEPLRRALTANPERVIVTQLDLEWLVNYPVRSVGDAAGAAKSLVERGVGEVVVTMFGDFSHPAVLLVNQAATLQVSAPITEKATSSGVEGAFAGGFLAALCQGAGEGEAADRNTALQWGAAAASYTAGYFGSEFGTMDDLRATLDMLQV